MPYFAWLSPTPPTYRIQLKYMFEWAVSEEVRISHVLRGDDKLEEDLHVSSAMLSELKDDQELGVARTS
ncbi:hypothetical protein NDU88_001962 [Pleurodeles waltl]|uniref:Uncharacterized protein n=1 Tax=Pleurodeles waltl TaxID=8319 RepID=A0AAV7W344_PLEWA|nr:hypothetical protein NDU88_001962 [Pleurodeles waltl]